MPSQKIPVDTEEQAQVIIEAIEKMGLLHTYKQTKKGFSLIVEYLNPIDLYYLGANVVAEATQVFKTAITR